MCKHLNGVLSEIMNAAHEREVSDGKLANSGYNNIGGIVGYTYECYDCGKIFAYSSAQDIKQGNLRADKILYPDGIGCCIWYPLSEDDEAGLCFDFNYEDVDDMIELLRHIKNVEAEIYHENGGVNNERKG